MAVDSSVLGSFIGTLEGTISVLLTLFAGYYVARCGYLNHDTVKRLSKLSTAIFLPCLIIVQMGPELTAPNLSKLWVIPLWGLVSTVIAHLLGWFGQTVLKLPYWTIVASGRPNANALPLLLLQSLQYTGVLDVLSAPGEAVSDTVHRAKSFLLLNAIVQQVVTLQSAPFLLKRDRTKNNTRDDQENGASHLTPGSSPHHLPSVVQDREHVGLLQEHRSYGAVEDDYSPHFTEALGPIADQPDIHWPRRVRFAEAPLKWIYESASPPLIAAIIALLLGVSGSILYYPCRCLLSDRSYLLCITQSWIKMAYYTARSRRAWGTSETSCMCTLVERPP